MSKIKVAIKKKVLRLYGNAKTLVQFMEIFWIDLVESLQWDTT